ncbi:hypothetical protein KCP78_20605 [Salmonella enterica subsp. enterica]|nr:hypothetical protein KCP78_20605 [Salmonella enterica subsp. enterica]
MECCGALLSLICPLNPAITPLYLAFTCLTVRRILAEKSSGDRYVALVVPSSVPSFYHGLEKCHFALGDLAAAGVYDRTADFLLAAVVAMGRGKFLRGRGCCVDVSRAGGDTPSDGSLSCWRPSVVLIFNRFCRGNSGSSV